MAMPAQSESGKVTVRIDPGTFARLRRAAEADRRPVAALARLLLMDALADRDCAGQEGSFYDDAD